MTKARSATTPPCRPGVSDDVCRLLQGYADAGSSWFDIFFIYRHMDELLAQMRLFAREVIPAFA